MRMVVVGGKSARGQAKIPIEQLQSLIKPIRTRRRTLEEDAARFSRSFTADTMHARIDRRDPVQIQRHASVELERDVNFHRVRKINKVNNLRSAHRQQIFGDF